MLQAAQMATAARRVSKCARRLVHTMQSQEDEQMIINIPFSEAVMIHSINISAMEGEDAPEDIKLFTNMPSLGFSDCDDGPCAAKLTLTAEDLLADRVCELKMAKFNYVNVLSVFEDLLADRVCELKMAKFNY